MDSYLIDLDGNEEMFKMNSGKTMRFQRYQSDEKYEPVNNPKIIEIEI